MKAVFPALAFAVAWACLLATHTHAQNQAEPPENTTLNGPLQPNDCVTQASSYHGVNAWIVRGIIKVESNFNTKAVNKNRNGTVDVGAAQINSMHFNELKGYGVAPADLMDGCIASYVAAWHLKKKITAYGNSWFAVGAYHSVTPCFNRRYSGLVWNALLGWKVVTGARAKVQTFASCMPAQTAKLGQKSAQPGGQSTIAFDVE